MIWIILIGVTYTHFIYHPTDHHAKKLITVKLDEVKILINIHDYFDSFLTLQCNLDHIVEDIYDNIKT